MPKSRIEPKQNEIDRGVSPVLGEALLIAIVVILAGVVAFIVLGVDTGGPGQPSADLAFQQTAHNGSTNNVTVTHLSGDDLPSDDISVKITDNSGDGADYGEYHKSMSGGSKQQIAYYVESGDVIWVIWDSPNSDATAVLGKYTVE